MQVTETSADGLKREYKIVVPAGEIAEQISRRLGEIGRSVRIPGFRPGKVPMQLLQRRFGDAVRGEVLESKLQDSSSEAIREQNVRPAMPPKVEIVAAAEGADFEYTMSLEILPDMPDPNFAEIGLERLVAEVPDEDIDRAVERIAEQQRKAEPVERPAANGDIVVADLVGHVGEDELPGSRGEGREIEVGAAGFLPGFTEQLVGATAGQERKVTITFPDDWGNPDFAGKEAIFDVTVKEVRERQPTKIDDALAEAVGLENLAELRDEIRQRMQRDYDQIARQRLKRTLLDKLADRYDFAVPPGMVDMEFDSIWQEYEAQKERQKEIEARAAGNAETADAETGGGESESAAAPSAAPVAEAAASDAVPEQETTGETAPPLNEEEEKAKAEYRRIAERRVRLGLLLAEVGRNNNITVTQEEINQALIREAQSHPGYERQVLDFYRKNPDSMNNLRAPIFEEKVVDFIVGLANAEERKVTPRELMAVADAGEPEDEGEAAVP